MAKECKEKITCFVLSFTKIAISSIGDHLASLRFIGFLGDGKGRSVS
jgi:hypothetical protein